jgi:hypothetical protein
LLFSSIQNIQDISLLNILLLLPFQGEKKPALEGDERILLIAF